METDIIRWARECGWVIYDDMPYMDVQAIQDALIERLERFAAIVRADEREQCAKVCEDLRPSKPEYDQRFYDGCTLSAAEIRQRHVQQEPQVKD